MILNNKDIKSIATYILMAWKYGKCGGLYTYIDLTKQEDAFEPNYGVTPQHYKDGQYWNRDWIAAGSDYNKMVIKHGVLMTSIDKEYRPNVCDNINCIPVNFIILDEVKCEHCKGCNRSESSVKDHVKAWAQLFVDELLKFNYYEVINAEGQQEYVWANDAIMECMKANGSITYCTPKYALASLIEEAPLNINAVPAPFEGCMGCAFEITFCDCLISDDSPLNYKLVTQENLYKKGKERCVDC